LEVPVNEMLLFGVRGEKANSFFPLNLSTTSPRTLLPIPWWRGEKESARWVIDRHSWNRTRDERCCRGVMIGRGEVFSGA